VEKLILKYDHLKKIHKNLNISLERYDSALHDKNAEIETIYERRDSVIKRFELTYDLLWKYLREYIITEGITVDSPKKVFQHCLSLGLINTEKTKELLDLSEDRNLTVPAYDMDTADRIAEDIKKYHTVINFMIIQFPPNTITK